VVGVDFYHGRRVERSCLDLALDEHCEPGPAERAGLISSIRSLGAWFRESGETNKQGRPAAQLFD